MITWTETATLAAMAAGSTILVELVKYFGAGKKNAGDAEHAFRQDLMAELAEMRKENVRIREAFRSELAEAQTHHRAELAELDKLRRDEVQRLTKERDHFSELYYNCINTPGCPHKDPRPGG